MIEYVTIKDYVKWLELEGEGLDKAINFMSYYLGKSEDEIREMGNEVLKEYDEFSKLLETTANPQFFPIIKIEEQLFGFCDITQMTLGEYVDLENLAKDTQKNMAQIISILYRPIKKHRFNSLKWNIVNTFNVYSNQITNIWDWYDLEKYNYSESYCLREKMERLPVGFALGALTFFLLQSGLTISASQAYSMETEKKGMIKKLKENMKKVIKKNSVNIGDGLLQFITYQKLPSFQLTGIEVLRI